MRLDILFFLIHLLSILQGVRADRIHPHDLNSLQCFLNSEPHLPKIALIATGGTISGRGESATDTTHYIAGAFHIDELLSGIRHDFERHIQVISHQLLQIDSINLNSSHLLTLIREIKEYLSQPDVRGVVVPAGSSVVRVMQRIFEHTIPANKPVVLVVASKPLTAYGSEGLANLLASIFTAAISEPIGVVILANDQIFYSYGTRKVNNRFIPGPDSLVGVVEDSKPKIKRRPRYVPKTFDTTIIPPEQKLPVVEVYTPYIGFSGDMVGSSVRKPSGIVLETIDDGYWPDESREIFEAYASDSVLVTVPRDWCCDVDHDRIRGAVPGNLWTVRDAPIMVAILMALGKSKEEISSFITQPYYEEVVM